MQLLAILCLTVSFQAQADPFASAETLDAELKRPWDSKAYLEAYINDYDQPDWPAFYEALSRRENWARNFIWELQPYAMLYARTGDGKYGEAVKRAVLSISKNPPGDLTFSLNAVCYLYDRVRKDLTAEERKQVDNAIATCADSALKGEKGTAMNRGLLNALGIAYVAKLLPDHPHHDTWEEAHRKMFSDDFERIKDTNEDATNYHFVWGDALVQYVSVTEKDPREFYARPYVKAIFERWLGMATPFGGLPTIGKSRWHYPEMAWVFEAAGAGLQDGRYRWLAQRILNYARANGQKMPNAPILDFVDDSVALVPPDGKSYYNDERMGAKIADKLIVRSGFGPKDTYVAFNLLNEAGHGTEDATALVGLFDADTPLLINPMDYEGAGEEQKNIVLFRRATENFPFSDIGPANDPQWRRAIHPIRTQHTALGGPNIDFEKTTDLILRIQPEEPGEILIDDIRVTGPSGGKVIANFEGSEPLPAGAALSDESVEGRHSLSQKITRWVKLPWKSPTDVSGYDSLEYWYRFTKPASVPIDLETCISSAHGTGRWQFFGTHRDSRLRTLRDFPGFHAASLEIEAKPYFGGTLRQYRDTLVLPGRLIWIRDTIQPQEEMELQFGPLWHADTLLSKGEDWIQLTQAPFEGAARGREAVWKFPPRNLLIRVAARQPNSRVVVEKNPIDTVARRWTIFGNWKGTTKVDQLYAFDSFLLPNELPAEKAPELAEQVKTLGATPEWTVIQLGDDYLVANPLGQPVKAGNIETDFHLLHLQIVDGKVAVTQGVQGTYAVFNGQSLHHSSSVSDLPAE